MTKRTLGSVALLAALIVGATAWVWWIKQFPIVSGEVASGTVWNDPPTSPDRGGNPIEPGSQVKVYEGFILVTTPKGERIISPHGWYSRLRLKPYRLTGDTSHP